MMRRLYVETLACLLAFSLASSVAAQNKTGQQKRMEEPQMLTDGEQRIVQRLSTHLRIDPDTILALRTRSLGWGDIELAILISQQSNTPLENVVSRWAATNQNWSSVGSHFGVQDVEALKEMRPDQDRTPEADPDATP